MLMESCNDLTDPVSDFRRLWREFSGFQARRQIALVDYFARRSEAVFVVSFSAL